MWLAAAFLSTVACQCVMAAGVAEPPRADTPGANRFQLDAQQPSLTSPSRTLTSASGPTRDSKKSHRMWRHLLRSLGQLNPGFNASKELFRPNSSSVPIVIPSKFLIKTASSKGIKQVFNNKLGRAFSLAISRLQKARARRRKLINLLRQEQLRQRGIAPDNSNQGVPDIAQGLPIHGIGAPVIKGKGAGAGAGADDKSAPSQPSSARMQSALASRLSHYANTFRGRLNSLRAAKERARLVGKRSGKRRMTVAEHLGSMLIQALAKN